VEVPLTSLQRRRGIDAFLMAYEAARAVTSADVERHDIHAVYAKDHIEKFVKQDRPRSTRCTPSTSPRRKNNRAATGCLHQPMRDAIDAACARPTTRLHVARSTRCS